MACPFFEPLELLPPGLWTHRPRLPLGEAWSGRCHAGGMPSEGRQFELCNHGYARGVCERFPEACSADAVRFSITCEEPLRLVYILEKDHAPIDYGELAPNAILAAQARAFLASHARLSAK